MVDIYNLYMDDSGTRHPDRNLDVAGSRPDWFALGGVLVHQNDEAQCRAMHEVFCREWEIDQPLHSHEIRNKKEKFAWIKDLETERQAQFYSALSTMLTSIPVIGIACTIDRPGYHRRYDEKYGKLKWSLCRSAFAICVERASKFARSKQCKLNVYVERSDKNTDNQIKQHFNNLKQSGHPFDPQAASKYNPLNQTFALTFICPSEVGREVVNKCLPRK